MNGSKPHPYVNPYRKPNASEYDSADGNFPCGCCILLIVALTVALLVFVQRANV